MARQRLAELRRVPAFILHREILLLVEAMPEAA
jgi:hypothetical protein